MTCRSMLIVGAFLCCGVGTARSQLVHGVHVLVPEVSLPDFCCANAIDFSTQTSTIPSSGDADLYYAEITGVPGAWLFHAVNDAHVVAVPDAFDDLVVAPEPTPGDITATATLRQTYVIKTGDGFYAKFIVREAEDGLPSGWGGVCCRLKIEYYVQLDGSRNLDSQLPVHATSWGRIKALSR
jgi:hypothetical protein